MLLKLLTVFKLTIIRAFCSGVMKWPEEHTIAFWRYKWGESLRLYRTWESCPIVLCKGTPLDVKAESKDILQLTDQAHRAELHDQ